MDKVDYIAGLELLKAKNPEHPLIPAIERGHSYMNCVYLEKALSTIPDEIDEEEDEYYEDLDASPSPQLDKLYDKMRELFTERAKLSNQFHDVATDLDRARISTSISKVQDSLETLFKQISYFRKHGKMPLETIDDRYPIPGTEWETIKKRNSLRSSISRAEKELKMLHKNNAPEERILKKEDFLKEKKIHLTHVEKALKAAGI